MKKYILLFVLFIGAFSMSASHLSGGDIQYRYIGDSTGVANHYEVLLRIYTDINGINMGNTETVRITSSCFSQINLSVSATGTNFGGISPTLFDCVDPTPNIKTLKIWTYKGAVVLPGRCTDIVFYWTSCCRPGGYTNAIATGSFYFEAKLNSQLGDNSSPIFVSEPVRSFCVGKQFNWKQSSIELDGDSIYYDWIHPRLTGPTANITFNSPFTYNNPISSTPPANLDRQTGLITFTPTAQEIDVCALIINEFRFDTVYNQWLPIGSSNREMTINIGTNCKTEVKDGVVLDTLQQGAYIDPSTGLMVKEYPCLSDTVHLKYKTPLDCQSVDRGDYRLTGANGQPIPIAKLEPICDFNGDAKKMIVHLYRPLVQNGDYYLYSKKGNDGNTLVNKCGYTMPENDSVVLRVNNCPVINWRLKNISVVDDSIPTIEWRWSNKQIPVGIFDYFEVFRSPDSLNWTSIGQVKDSTAKSFEDFSFIWSNNTWALDKDSFYYKLDVVLGGQVFDQSNTFHSIRLRSKDNPDVPGNNLLRWSPYLGWPGAEYTIMLGTKTGNTYTWQPMPAGYMEEPQGVATTTEVTAEINVSNLPRPAEYAVRIDASDPLGGQGYIASSNWWKFGLEEPPIEIPDTIKIPNVFTPNNDGQNDEFNIANIEGYKTSRRVVILNRWGKVVYETDGYTNDQPWDGTNNAGQELPDGTYMYMIELYDEASGKRENFEGHINLFR